MDQQEEQLKKTRSQNQSQKLEYDIVWFSRRDWRSFKKKISDLSPVIAILFIVFSFGFWSGSYYKGQDIVLDCKYASSFRVSVDSFECRRKI